MKTPALLVLATLLIGCDPTPVGDARGTGDARPASSLPTRESRRVLDAARPHGGGKGAGATGR